MSQDEFGRLEKLSVKELRRQAALRNVPLTQIGSAVEKSDLINLIIRAAPVLDQYDVSTGVKVHSAETIATRVERAHGGGGKKKKKRGRRRGSSSSSSSSTRSRSRSRGRRRGRSRSRRKGRSRSRHKKRSRSRRHSRTPSRSPSLTILTPLPGGRLPAPSPQAHSGRPPSSRDSGGSTAAKRSSSSLQILPIADAAAPATAPPAPQKRLSEPSVAQAGMAAAAALGFDVLPKAPMAGPMAPAAGLRPSINSCAPAPYGSSYMPGGRVCIQYLCTSRCDLGANCPEGHIIDPEEEMRVRARFKEQECHYGAQCTRAGCLFRHPGEKFEEGNLVPEGQQVTLKVTPHGMTLDFM